MRYKGGGSYDGVSEPVRRPSPVSLLTLREIRGYIRGHHAIAMTVTFVLLYALGSMVIGGMLVFANLGGGYEVQVLWGSALGTQPWLYPGILIVAPWGVVALPFFQTLAMGIVAIGVGLGMAVAVLLGVDLVRNRRRAAARPASVGTIAGLTPAMIALVTLGACCSTTAAATAGVWVVAQVSGSSADNLLYNNWFLGAFQIVVVWVALIAQEIVLGIYGGLLGLRKETEETARYVAPPVERRYLAATALRLGLLVGGITWSLAMLVEWTQPLQGGSDIVMPIRWVVQHQVPALLAILAALFPRGVYDTICETLRNAFGSVLRGLFVLGGLTLIIGTPPPLAGAGLEGFGNELLGLFGLPASSGAVPPVFPWGPDLLFRWGLQYLLVGGFSLAVGLFPDRTLSVLLWGLGRFESTRTPTGDFVVGSPTAIPSTETPALSGSTIGRSTPAGSPAGVAADGP